MVGAATATGYAEAAWSAWLHPVRAVALGHKPPVSDGYGIGKRGRTPPDGHMGLDIMGRRNERRMPRRHPDQTPWYTSPPGAQIVASAPGKVIRAGMIENGYRVAIDHGRVGLIWLGGDVGGDGEALGACQTLYLHMERLHVVQGQTVRAGDHIGDMGYNPRVTGAIRHLHWEIWLRRLRTGSRRGTRGEIDPQPLLSLMSWIDRDGAIRLPDGAATGASAPSPGDSSELVAAAGLALGVGVLT